MNVIYYSGWYFENNWKLWIISEHKQGTALHHHSQNKDMQCVCSNHKKARRIHDFFSHYSSISDLLGRCHGISRPTVNIYSSHDSRLQWRKRNFARITICGFWQNWKIIYNLCRIKKSYFGNPQGSFLIELLIIC